MSRQNSKKASAQVIIIFVLCALVLVVLVGIVYFFKYHNDGFSRIGKTAKTGTAPADQWGQQYMERQSPQD